MTNSDTASSLSRRAVLAGAAASAAATAGCVGRLQRIGTESGRSQLSLEITALPVDTDPYGIQIAQQLRANLEAVGVDVRLSLVPTTQFTEQVLLNHDYDIYVGQVPFVLPPDPDALYPLFGSRYASDPGWQNPFGFASDTCDDLLGSQRRDAGGERRQAVTALQEELARYQPISPLVFPERLTGVRTDRFTGWDPDDRAPARGGPTRPHNLLLLDRVDGAPPTLRLATADDRLTGNRNPISAAYQPEGSLLDLVYDPIALDHGTEQLPWLARDLTWVDSGDLLEVEIRLRDGLRWHDDSPDQPRRLSAFDVGFTYEFLQDTSLGAASEPIPTERFRGPVSLVDEVTVENASRLRLTFTETTRPVARRALTVPILPSHIWDDRTRLVDGPNRAGRTTVALTAANSSAIGSGPFRFETSDDSSIELIRFEPHFLWAARGSTPGPGANETASEDGSPFSIFDAFDGDTDDDSDAAVANETATRPAAGATATADVAPPPEPYGTAPPFTTITLETVSTTSVVGLVASGNADATLGPIRPRVKTAADNSSEIELVESRPNAFYHLGFNTRREPLRHPEFRRFLARLVDKSMLVEESFDGYGSPAASPLAETDWIADSLRWDAETEADPLFPFLGSDGELSVDEARERLRELGYRYTSNNELVS